jgi:hypothetical protein
MTWDREVNMTRLTAVFWLVFWGKESEERFGKTRRKSRKIEKISRQIEKSTRKLEENNAKAYNRICQTWRSSKNNFSNKPSEKQLIKIIEIRTRKMSQENMRNKEHANERVQGNLQEETIKKCQSTSVDTWRKPWTDHDCMKFNWDLEEKNSRSWVRGKRKFSESRSSFPRTIILWIIKTTANLQIVLRMLANKHCFSELELKPNNLRKMWELLGKRNQENLKKITRKSQETAFNLNQNDKHRKPVTLDSRWQL